VCWFYLKPEEDWINSGLEQLQTYQHQSTTSYQDKTYLVAAQTRMKELQDYHQISQRYVLPFPYICQIYHLLNLKHLENVHSFSLSNLRVVGVNEVRPSNSALS
jgi:hypothetical protein